MADLSDLVGAFGKKPKPAVRTEDNLLSDDYLEVIIGLTEGPIKGLVPGDKPDRPLENFFIDETPLQNEATGMSNFSDFQVDIYNGYENDGPIQNKLGGVSSNLSIGVRLSQNMDVIRQTPAFMRGNINQLEVRILLNQLMVQNDKGIMRSSRNYFPPKSSRSPRATRPATPTVLITLISFASPLGMSWKLWHRRK